MPPDPSQQLALVAAAARAPSPHNTQPARWRFVGDQVELHATRDAWLAVGDTSGRDDQLALGAAWEGMALALGEQGWALASPERGAPVYPPATGLRLVARAALRPGGSRDALAEAVARRRSWRGRFATATAEQRAALGRALAAQGVAAVDEPAALATLAVWHDAASVEALGDERFADELRAWLRLDPKDPRTARDGLSAACLLLSGVEAQGARVMLHPTVLRVLRALRLSGLLAAEAGAVRSATAVLLLHAPTVEPVFDSGRRLYRLWLRLALADLAAVPMSALVDSARTAARLNAAHPPPVGQQIVTVLRVGPAPVGGAPASARLPAQELLLG